MANIREQWGLDKSYPEQYWVFVSGLARGDLGRSLIQRRPVTTMIGEALPNSLSLAFFAFVARHRPGAGAGRDGGDESR